MKKAILFIFLWFFTASYISAQLIHSKGITNVGLSCGLGGKSFIPGIVYQHHISDVSRLGASLNYYKFNFPLSNYTSYYFNAEYAYTITKATKNIYLNAIGGGLAGYETLKTKISDNKNNRIFFGENIGVSLEYYFASKFKFELQAKEQFFQHSLTLKNDYYIGISVIKQL